MKPCNKVSGRYRYLLVLIIASPFLFVILHSKRKVQTNIDDALVLEHPLTRADLSLSKRTIVQSNRYRNISHIVRNYKQAHKQIPVGKYNIQAAYVRTTSRPIIKTNSSLVVNTLSAEVASGDTSRSKAQPQYADPNVKPNASIFRSPLLPNGAKLQDENVKDLLKKHSDDFIDRIARRVPFTKKSENLCLSLKPSRYIKNDALILTKDEMDIGTYNKTNPLIPKIIHQTWNTYDIPNPAVPYVKSVLQQNPGWQYWFWTQHDIQCYLRHRHPEFTTLYNDYEASIFKTDVMRYFILYDFGGFYLDLDVECLKPLDIWTHIGSTILSHETYEHTFFGHMRKQPNVMTTILATAPGHPYYKLLQDNLLKYHRVCPKNVLYSTGPFYIDNIYQLYVQAYAKDHDPEITVIHPRYWLPSYANGFTQKIRYMCEKKSPSQLTQQQRDFKVCETAKQRRFYNGPFYDSYLNHYWMNSNVKGSKFLTKETTSIFDLVPNLKRVSDILGLKCT